MHLLLGDFGQRRTRLLVRKYFIEDLLVDVGTLSDVLEQVSSFLLRHGLLVLVRQELRPQLLDFREDLRLLILGEADTLVVRLFDNVAFHVDDGLALERCGFLSFFLLLRRFSRQSLHFDLLALLQSPFEFFLLLSFAVNQLEVHYNLQFFLVTQDLQGGEFIQVASWQPVLAEARE